ncbi:MAG: VOC family protein [Pseudomonadota bacterium]
MNSATQEPITGLDHCIILVRDLDTAAERMRALGFAPAPRGVHSEHMGSHNHCVMLERGYFEVMALRFPTEHNERWQAALAVREGLAAIALETNDAQAAAGVFESRGVPPARLVDFSRPVDLGGETRDASFTTLTLPDSVSPVPSFLCHHHTRDVVWRPEYLKHANGACAFLGLVMVAADPQATAAQMSPAYGAHRRQTIADGVRIDMGSSAVNIVTAAAFAGRYAEIPLDAAAVAPYLGAIRIGVTDAAVTDAWLTGHGVATHRSAAGTTCIAPADACGALIEFVA